MIAALSPTKLAFFKMKRGLMKNGCGELLETLERAEVASWTWGGGALTAALTVSLTDGTSWELEVPRASKGAAERLGKALGFG